ncbi:MAG TPA: hypothetical protein DEH11_06310, partial [Actinobacteria bacterium]|nr:hypothetical protein [Actinomycetota bacterium]
MPEGDVVWQTANRLHEALAGRMLTRTDFRVPRYATADLTGREVTEAVARGKHLLVRVDGGATIHTHLRMDGSWRIRPAGGYPPRDHRVRLILANDQWQAVGYLLGVVEILPTAREERAVGHLGPDLLGPDWDTAEAVRRLSAARRTGTGRRGGRRRADHRAGQYLLRLSGRDRPACGPVGLSRAARPLTRRGKPQGGGPGQSPARRLS